MNDSLKKIWTEKDINDLIDSRAEESPYLEFKRADAIKLAKTLISNGTHRDKAFKLENDCKSEIAKDVSAFANSDGGVLIYGIAEDKHVADSLSYINGNEITKEWLEQIINSKIQRRIEGLVIDPVRMEGDIEKTVYVVKIPRSIHAPHMTSDKKYYKRNNFQAVEMEEYEVRDAYFRERRTVLKIAEPHIGGTTTKSTFNSNKFKSCKFYITFNVNNISSVLEKSYKLEVQFPSQLVSKWVEGRYFFHQKYFIRVENRYSIFSIPNQSPLFQNEYTAIETVYIIVPFEIVEVIFKNPVLMKLYYSGGVDEKSILLTDYLIHSDNRKVQLEDFAP